MTDVDVITPDQSATIKYINIEGVEPGHYNMSISFLIEGCPESVISRAVYVGESGTFEHINLSVLRHDGGIFYVVKVEPQRLSICTFAETLPTQDIGVTYSIIWEPIHIT